MERGESSKAKAVVKKRRTASLSVVVMEETPAPSVLFQETQISVERILEMLKIDWPKGAKPKQNRPMNSQNVADALQKYNLKKTAIQKALDSLSDSGQISFKEYGKQKIYLARQDQFDIPNPEELEQMKKANGELQEELGVQKKTISEVEAEIRVLQSNLTLAEIRAKESTLKTEVREMEKKLKTLSEGTPLVDPEERNKVEETYLEKLNQWRKRKRIFKDLWDAITENSPKDVKEFKEELGIEYDEDVSVSIQSFSELLANRKKRKVQ